MALRTRNRARGAADWVLVTPNLATGIRFMTLPVRGASASCLDLDPTRGASATLSTEPAGPLECAADAPVVLLGAAFGPPAPVCPPDGTTPAVHALRERALRFCREADSVVEGFLCDEPVVVSDACRKPGNAFDAYVCDEPRMQALQKTVLRETWSILKALLLGLFRR